MRKQDAKKPATPAKRKPVARKRAASKSAATGKTPKAKAPAKAGQAEPGATPKRQRFSRGSDPRIPPAGTTIVRPYKGQEIRVEVLEDGFRWDGRKFRSVSATAAAITGAKSINGPLWFGLTAPRDKPAKARDVTEERKANLS